MHAVRRRLRACAWLALLSILALSAGPTISRLLLPPGGAVVSGAASHSMDERSMGEAMAAPDGMGSAHHRHHDIATAAATAPTPSHAPAHEHALEHCGLCLLAAHAFTFAQEWSALNAFVERTPPALNQLAAAVPRLRGDWSPASSRGPPLRG